VRFGREEIEHRKEEPRSARTEKGGRVRSLREKRPHSPKDGRADEEKLCYLLGERTVYVGEKSARQKKVGEDDFAKKESQEGVVCVHRAEKEGAASSYAKS